MAHRWHRDDDCGGVVGLKSASCELPGGRGGDVEGVRDHKGVVPSFRRPIELSPQGSWRVSWHCPRDLLGCCR
jgi:hypothetical protein